VPGAVLDAPPREAAHGRQHDRTRLVVRTAIAGYGLDLPAVWRNEELEIPVRSELEVLKRLESEFLAVWEAATTVGADVIGIATDFPTVYAYSWLRRHPGGPAR